MQLKLSDITARAKFLDLLNEGVSVKSSEDFTYVYGNQFCLQNAAKLTEKEFLGYSDYQLPWDNYADSYVSNDKAILNGVGGNNMLFMLTDAHGDKCITHHKKYICYDDNGSIAGIVAIFKIVEGRFYEMYSYMTNLQQDNLNICSYLQNNTRSFDPSLKLTAKESICLFYTLQNFTAKKVANIMAISSKTVEQHLANIRNKWDCNNKQDLLDTANMLGCFNVIPIELFLSHPSLAQ